VGPAIAGLRLATRGSALAVAQAEWVADQLGGAELVKVRSGDGEPGDKSRFVRGVESALLDGAADLGVHSAKDLPGQQPDGLALAGVPAREDPADAFVGPARSLTEVPEAARVGTASLRRRAQLAALRPDLRIVELRGNVDTRLQKLTDGECDGLVLALAGLRRLGREADAAFSFGVEEMTPAAGQGALAIQAAAGAEEAVTAAGAITDRTALVELTAERAAVAALEATCDTPVGICARLGAADLTIHGFAGLPDGSEWVRDSVEGDAEQPAALGGALAERMLAAGAGELLERATAEAAP
jgi:hydroxymethylbilane synthase